MWIRLVDVPAALEGRGYVGDDRIVFEVRDAFCPWNEGTYLLEASSAGASCRRTDGQPDITLTINELGSVYLGGVTFAQLSRAGRLVERRDGSVRRADAMFASDIAPHCPVMF
jgi:predicted acetyltransferase